MVVPTSGACVFPSVSLATFLSCFFLNWLSLMAVYQLSITELTCFVNPDFLPTNPVGCVNICVCPLFPYCGLCVERVILTMRMHWLKLS